MHSSQKGDLYEYQVYHSLEEQQEELKIAGCWAHVRRRYDEALKALTKACRKSSLSYLALRQIQAIYREEGKLTELPSDDVKRTG